MHLVAGKKAPWFFFNLSDCRLSFPFLSIWFPRMHLSKNKLVLHRKAKYSLFGNTVQTSPLERCNLLPALFLLKQAVTKAKYMCYINYHLRWYVQDFEWKGVFKKMINMERHFECDKKFVHQDRLKGFFIYTILVSFWSSHSQCWCSSSNNLVSQSFPPHIQLYVLVHVGHF